MAAWMEKGTRRLIEGDSTNLHNREFPWKKNWEEKVKHVLYSISAPLCLHTRPNLKAILINWDIWHKKGWPLSKTLTNLHFATA